MEKRAVLLVDDEADVLEDFLYKNIRTHLNGFECIACKTTDEARNLTDYLDSEGVKIPLIVVDEVMKGSSESGNDLIKYLDQTHPKARKILLSGQATSEEIIRALNEAGANTYIPKSRVMNNPQPLLKTIDQLLEEYNKDVGVEFVVRDRDNSEIVIRAAETAYEIHQAAKLVFMVYHDLEKRYREGVLTPEEIEKREKWDKADFREDGSINPYAKHFVAMKGGKCVGSLRLWMDTGPLDGFDFGTGDRPTLRAGKWMVHPDYRMAMLPIETNFEDQLYFKSPIAIPLLIHAFISARYEFRENEIYLTCLPKLVPTYSRLGFKLVGEPFMHQTLKGDDSGEHPGMYVGMKLNIDETVEEYFAVKEGRKRSEDSSLSMNIADTIIIPLKSSKINDYITEYRTPWMRYEVNGK